MMRPCSQCLENNWKFEKLEDCFIRATCEMCNNEVEWQSTKLLAKQKRIEENPDYSGGSVTYEMVGGKIFNDGIEVDVYKNEKGWVQMRPVKFYTSWEIAIERPKEYLRSV